eukprot:CAMPEP_0170243602 /NCGR_PEP_ID=MMETSP0116_2-20130129/21577_1 /TAXON_ID=400756 /ORGANISM="Durinskia baltica, Strain CSIRO CS-38" /LENGTH=204 /DNA_ID=CAMNT_0010494457 /DNA_START=118 /DNA_END=732 /DNA_ORIENTATION=-
MAQDGPQFTGDIAAVGMHAAAEADDALQECREMQVRVRAANKVNQRQRENILEQFGFGDGQQQADRAKNVRQLLSRKPWMEDLDRPPSDDDEKDAPPPPPPPAEFAQEDETPRHSAMQPRPVGHLVRRDRRGPSEEEVVNRHADLFAPDEAEEDDAPAPPARRGREPRPFPQDLLETGSVHSEMSRASLSEVGPDNDAFDRCVS